MHARNGSVIEYSVTPQSDDPSGEIHEHLYMPPLPGGKWEDTERDRVPSPGYEISLKNLGPTPVQVDTGYPYAALIISDGTDAGESVTVYRISGEPDWGVPLPESLDQGAKTRFYMPMLNLNARIRGKLVTCRLVITPTLLARYPGRPWAYKGKPPSIGDLSTAISSEFQIKVP